MEPKFLDALTNFDTRQDIYYATILVRYYGISYVHASPRSPPMKLGRTKWQAKVYPRFILEVPSCISESAFSLAFWE